MTGEGWDFFNFYLTCLRTLSISIVVLISRIFILGFDLLNDHCTDLFLKAAREREKAEKAKNKQLQGLKSGANSAATSRASSPTPGSPSLKATKQPGGKKATSLAQSSKPPQPKAYQDQQSLDMESLNLGPKDAPEPVNEPPPKMSLARERVLEEARNAIDSSSKKAVSLVVIGK